MRKDRKHFWPSNLNLVFIQLLCAWWWLQTLLLFSASFPLLLLETLGTFCWWHQFVCRAGSMCPAYTHTYTSKNPSLSRPFRSWMSFSATDFGFSIWKQIFCVCIESNRLEGRLFVGQLIKMLGWQWETISSWGSVLARQTTSMTSVLPALSGSLVLSLKKIKASSAFQGCVLVSFV